MSQRTTGATTLKETVDSGHWPNFKILLCVMDVLSQRSASPFNLGFLPVCFRMEIPNTGAFSIKGSFELGHHVERLEAGLLDL